MIMKKLKLFPKIFLYTFSVMLFIIIIAHIMIYTFPILANGSDIFGN